MIELVDTHCHIQSIGEQSGEDGTRRLWAKQSSSKEEIIERAEADGVKKLICVGCTLDDSRLAIKAATAQPNIWASIGIHPHEAKHYYDSERKMAEFAALADRSRVVAIGECGLDFYYNHSPKKEQVAVLEFQLSLALDQDLPVIFHVRDAFDDFWPIFNSLNSKGQPIRGVLHSFTDNKENLDKAIASNLYVGVNGIATFTKDPTQAAMYKQIPLSNLLLETDSPFLTPPPFRGSINEPKSVRIIAEYLANLRGEDLEQLAQVTTDNAQALFKI